MGAFVAILLVFSLIAGGSSGTNNQDIINEMNKPEQVMKQVLASPEDILTSKENITTATQLLAALPEAKNKLKVAVYSIQDKTGQFEEDSGSRVVTQGATEMLITALERSRQFKILDRVRFGDIMNEQNLQTNKRLAENEGPKIGRMTGADYVLAGAITEYQVDKNTGGIGLKIAGKGGSQQYARATCALDLRLTDVTTGEIVWAESLKGEITGKKVGVQLFSFMGGNVVEFESGKGEQQVINLVVRTILEEAVYKLYESLIKESTINNQVN